MRNGLAINAYHKSIPKVYQYLALTPSLSTCPVTSERSVNTYRGLIGVERPIWKFWKSAWHRRLSSHFFKNSAIEEGFQVYWRYVLHTTTGLIETATGHCFRIGEPIANVKCLDLTPFLLSPFLLSHYKVRILSIWCLMKAAHASIAFSYTT